MEERLDELIGEPNWQIIHPLNIIVIMLFAILSFQLLAVGAYAIVNFNKARHTQNLGVASNG